MKDKIITSIIATMGAINVVFSIATPIFLSMLVIDMMNYTGGWQYYTIFWVGLISALYRGIKFIPYR